MSLGDRESWDSSKEHGECLCLLSRVDGIESLSLSLLFIYLRLSFSPSFFAFSREKESGLKEEVKNERIWYIVKTSERKSRFNRRGFEIMKFTAWRLDTALTSANRVCGRKWVD